MKPQVLALICRICPFCVAARMWPQSRLAKKLAEVEKDCPACNAYKEIYGRRQETKTEQ